MHATYAAHPNLLDLITLIIFGEQYKLRSSSLCSSLHPPVYLLSYIQIFSLALYTSDTLNLFFSLKTRDQVL
jgi:hypothetical protein